MQTYNNRLRTILETGKKRSDRTGVGTISRFGGEDEYHMFDGFPLYGNRAILLRWIHTELRWMLRGDSNIRWMQEQGVTIWDEWALKPEMVRDMGNFDSVQFERDLPGLIRAGKNGPTNDYPNSLSCTFEEMELWLAERNTKIEDYLFYKEGDIGKMYPTLWRNFDGIDQIRLTLDSIRNDPYGRRHCVSAWDPKQLPLPGHSPEENVIEGRGALATCHHFFQFYVEDLTLHERMLVAVGEQARDLWRLEDNTDALYALLGIEDPMETVENITRLLDDLCIPSQGLSISFHMRSNDTILGAPYNIASYAMLLMMYCDILGMAPMKVVHQVGDAHIYLNHLDQIEEMLERPCPPNPWLSFREDLKPGQYKDPVEYNWKDFVLTGYTPGEKMSFPIAK